MNTSLPASIEAYLKEAGFSQTEMLILRRMLEDDTLTVRELGTKMGKSPGVVDQAMKKLISKKIIRKENINGNPKYFINSLDAIVAWVKEDTVKRKQMLDRRHQNIEAFVGTLKLDQKLPDLQHFHGEEGIQKVYEKLLESKQEFLTFMPVLSTEEDDPLRQCKVDIFRLRQARKIFQRVLTPDTPLSRRFQSRDPFDFRKTVLIPSDELDISFEKTIAGDMIACIDHRALRACLLRYPELAKTERAVFESAWSHAADRAGSPCGKRSDFTPCISRKTKVLSWLRDFMLSSRSVCLLTLFAVISGVLTLGLSMHNRDLNVQRMKDKVLSIAITGSLQFHPTDIAALNIENDWRKPQWRTVVGLLDVIRQENDSILFAYIIRKDPLDARKMQFVADAYSINPYANTDDNPNNDVDVNHNGVIDGPDALQWPGQAYETAPEEAFAAYEAPTTTNNFYEDQWGKVITGYAPIRDAAGKTIAVLAIDMTATKLDQLDDQSFVPLYVFFGFFALFVFIRLAAENRFVLHIIFPARRP